MDFAQIATEVQGMVKRPDKMAAIYREINMATTFFSSSALFSRDVYEESLVISPTDYTQSIAIADLTRFRQLKYLKRIGTREYLTRLPASELGTLCDSSDKWYIAGTSINVSMTKTAAGVDIAYYQYPAYITVDATETYWMLEAGWPMIINRVAAKIFANIGDDASAKMHENYARIDYASFFSGAEKDIGFENA